MTSDSKLIYKQFKTLIPSISQKDLNKLLEMYSEIIGDKSEHSIKQMSYKCFECNLQISGKKSAGYGRCEQDAYCNSIKNMLQILIEQNTPLNILRICMKKITQPNQQSIKQNLPRKSIVGKHPLSTVVLFENKENNKNKRSTSCLKLSNQSLNVSLFKSTSNKNTVEQELQSAKIKITQLQLRIKTLEQQNRELKQQFKSEQQVFTKPSQNTNPILVMKKNNYLDTSQIDMNRLSLGPNQKSSHHQRLNSSVQQVHCKSQLQIKKNEPVKSKIPRLKLEILPNFHGKSNKSINHSFLAHQQTLGK